MEKEQYPTAKSSEDVSADQLEKTVEKPPIESSVLKGEEVKNPEISSSPTEDNSTIRETVTETVEAPTSSEHEAVETEEIPSGDEQISDGEEGGGSKKKIIILSLAVVLIIGLAAGGYMFKDKIIRRLPFIGQETPSVTLTPTVKPTASPTEVPKKVDKSKYEIKVLNGSGIKGEAGKVQEILEGEDFTVSSTGNAADFDFQETVIQAKRDVEKEFIDALKKALEDDYKLGDVEILDEDSDDVVVIVGSDKNE